MNSKPIGFFRVIQRAAVIVILGVLIGLGSVYGLLHSAPLLNTVESGPWRTSLLMGSAEADAYTRAAVAVNGVLALSREETIYFIATQDSSGLPLRAECQYRLSGPAPAARWWSVTAYAGDMFLMPVPQKRYSVSGDDFAGSASPTIAFVVGPQTVADSPSIPTMGSGDMVLTLRLYNPAPLIVAAPKRFVAPTISKEGSCA